MFGAQLLPAFRRVQSVLALLGDLNSSISAAGTNQATATLLTTVNNIITTVTFGQGVRLPLTPTVSAGDKIWVANNGANDLWVYPPVGGILSGTTLNMPAVLPTGKGAVFFCIDGTNYSAILGH